ncbi:BRCA2-interacting transcriptional repressor EMSY, partial [Caerostris extrusa]
VEAYASMVTAFRAQGSLTKEKRRMLQELCSMLGISEERHKAEVRRVVNDEHLHTIAERLFGSNTATEWAIEGRRILPLVNRLVPQTVFTEIANTVASSQIARNASLPLPGKTGSKMSNGTETMACRKRKEHIISDSSISPQKMSAMDSHFFRSLHHHDCQNSGISEQVPDVSVSSENFPVSETGTPNSSSVTDSSLQRTISTVAPTHPTQAALTIAKSKHQILKSSSTFSNFDHLNSNLASKGVSLSPIPVISHEEHVSTASDVVKSLSDTKITPRPLSSLSSMKSSTIVIPTNLTSSSTSSSSDRISTSSSTISQNKYLSHIRTKPSGHTRQNLPAGLGIKLTPQSQISQRVTVSPKSSSVQVKPDNATIFTRKTTSVIFPTSMSSDNSTSQFPQTISNDLTITKTPIIKPSPKPESQAVVNQQSVSKQSTIGKNMPKTSTTTVTTSYTYATTTLASTCISRPLFSSKGGSKTLSPVIFNVATTSCAPHQTNMKTAAVIQSESTKPAAQLITKSTTIGISPNHLKINTANPQTIQYRNDGGLVRSARIVNISQPVGARLPCAISSSTFSAIGLSSSPTALRVTLPAGTLNTTNSIRVTSQTKPNVIVVHKAQMWPRQPTAAVFMSSVPSKKLSNDVQEAVTQKADKSKPSGIKPIPRAIIPPRPQSPVVSITPIKSSETNPVSQSSTTQLENSTSDTQNVKSSDNNNEMQCKKNLLADVMEASGILDGNTIDKSSKDKTSTIKSNKEISNMSNHQSIEIRVSEVCHTNSSTSDAISRLSESNASKVDITSNKGDSVLSIQIDRSGKDVSKQVPVEALPKDSENTVFLSSHSMNENLKSNMVSTSQKEVTKDS